MTATISVRGQMVLPAQIRKRYGIAAQSKVEILDFGNEIVIVPIPKRPFAGSKGLLKGVSSRDLIEARRSERLREHGGR
jgi:AbrB family looped-hinge helix DNA binding protein